ncbi:putative membrane protein [Weissella oryzae SG25]|uniref:Putative membrane protein n=1 Tax=Weissella oryzae (strain DSM 25784 / JCM 18191 / LMG 30913 / SG25) TaxID=1329250 RepID=A0A069CUB5_WEIOS|nr:hypothetical protein [Weissella oryzae]GAK30783.1 putative membrane protein [Weissella oryzae SG25]
MKILNRCLGVIVILVTSIFLFQNSVYANDSNPFANTEKSETVGNITDNGGKNSEFNDNKNTNTKSISEVKDEAKGFDKQEVLKHLNNQDIDYINTNLLSNYQPYHQKEGSFDFSTTAAHIFADLFTSINKDVIYMVFDKALALLFDLTNVQNSTNDLFKQTTTFSTSFFNNKAFKQFIYLAFAVGILTVFIRQLRNHGGFKAIFLLLAAFILGSAWIAGGGIVLEKVNNITSTAEITAFQATSSNSNVTQVSDFQQALRYQFFKQAIERPFYLENFNTTENKSIDTKKMGDPIDFIRGAVDNSSDDVPDKNPNMQKDGKKSWYQFIIALISPVTSLAYGIPLFTIGLFNIGLQFASVVIYFFAPFAILISLIPKYAASGVKTAISAVGVLFGKVFLIFGIVLLNWVQGFADHLVPPTDSGSSILNAVFYVTLLWLIWKNKGRIFGTITGSHVAERIADKTHARKPYEEMKKTYGNVKDKVDSGRKKARKAQGDYQKAKKWAEKKFGKYDYEEQSEPRSQQSNSDPDEARTSEEVRQRARNRDRNSGNNKPDKQEATAKNYAGRTDTSEVQRAKRQRQAARSFTLHKPEYNNHDIKRDERNKSRIRSNEV